MTEKINWSAGDWFAQDLTQPAVEQQQQGDSVVNDGYDTNRQYTQILCCWLVGAWRTFCKVVEAPFRPGEDNNEYFPDTPGKVLHKLRHTPTFEYKKKEALRNSVKKAYFTKRDGRRPDAKELTILQ